MSDQTSKQLLFYEQVKPVSKTAHGRWAVGAEHSYGFAAATNMVPLTAAEFSAAASDFPIVFTVAGQSVLPVAVLGLERGKSSFVGANGNWQAKYIPAFVRRYPFVLSPIEGDDKFVLCIDETYDGWDKDGGSGSRLFTDDGEQTDYLKEIVQFTNRFQAEHARSLRLGKLLSDHELLDPMQLKLAAPDGGNRSVRGFRAVNRDKLQRLEAARLAEWHKSGVLEAIYLHLWSLRNFRDLAAKIPARDAADTTGGGTVDGATTVGAKIAGRATRVPDPDHSDGTDNANGAGGAKPF